MMKATILFADNEKDFLESRKETLEQEGFRVLPALDPTEAKNILEQGRVDLAIIDIRLVNDRDEHDLSGLNLAKRVAPNIPKIILTKFPTWEAVRDALGPQLEGLPPAVAFVAKQEGPHVLISAIRKALKLERGLAEISDNTADQIKKDYEDARRQAKSYFWASIIAAAAGMIVIYIGIGLTLGEALTYRILSVIAGVIAEAAGVLFFRRADIANERMDRYHRELLENWQFDKLLAACNEHLPVQSRYGAKEKIIEKAAEHWFIPALLDKSSRSEHTPTQLEK